MRYELCFPSLDETGVEARFPCDEHGEVLIDQLAPRRRMAYLMVRTCIGCSFGRPHAEPAATPEDVAALS
ncbi:MAG: hypothetical protein ABI574_02655 [Burkholderiales bacterium]